MLYQMSVSCPLRLEYAKLTSACGSMTPTPMSAMSSLMEAVVEMLTNFQTKKNASLRVLEVCNSCVDIL